MTSNRLEDNPFFILELPVIASRADVERAGQKLLALLAVGAASAHLYATPLGTRERDENKVRAAVATLRNPEERLLNELWASTCAPPGAAVAPLAWSTAFRSIHWRGPCTAD